MNVRKPLTTMEQHYRQTSLFSLADANSGAKNSSVIEAVYEAGGNVPPHIHLVEEIMLFLSGEGILFIGQEPHSVCAGVTVVIPAGKPHCLYNTGVGRLRVISFSPTSKLEFEWLPGLFPENHPLPDENGQDMDDPAADRTDRELNPVAA